MCARLIHVLMVDDDEGDVRLTQETLAESKFVNKVSIAKDGVEAMEFLRKEGEHADAERPDLILLDINMPRMDGHETLKAIREDPSLGHIPVVILTTSDADADILKAYQQHTNAYVKKPVDVDSFMGLVKAIQDFWVGIVHLPPK